MRANRSQGIFVRLTPEELRQLRSIGAASDADAVRALIFEHQNNQALAEDLYERLQEPLARLVKAEVDRSLVRVVKKVDELWSREKGAA